MHKILVTGGNGLVGRNLVPALRACYEAEVLAPGRDALDLMSAAQVESYIATHKPDVVLHLASRVGGIQANIASPIEFLVENQQININLIYAAYKSGVPTLLNLGTSCMYPKDRQSLVETDLLTGLLEPTNEGYALAKITAARLCQYISLKAGFDYRTIVPCNLYGPYDHFDESRSHLVPAIIKKLDEAKRQQMQEVMIWGDGQARREFMYVGDLVDFMLFALPRIEKLPSLLNVGLGYDYSVNDYYEVAAKVVGFEGGFSHDLEKPAGMQQKLLNITQLKSFGWEAKTDLQTGLQKTYEYYLTKLVE